MPDFTPLSSFMACNITPEGENCRRTKDKDASVMSGMGFELAGTWIGVSAPTSRANDVL